MIRTFADKIVLAVLILGVLAFFGVFIYIHMTWGNLVAPDYWSATENK